MRAAVARVQLFGVGIKGLSPAINAQRRINCYVVPQEDDQTQLALVGSPGLTLFSSALGSSPSRGMWAVNTLATPLVFTVNSGILYSLNNSATLTVIGAIGTNAGDVSFADDGTYLVFADRTNVYYYNMVTPAGITTIVPGVGIGANIASNPKYVTWQDTYFVVSDGTKGQFILSKNADPTVTWPAVQVGVTGSGAGAIQAVMADHSVLNVFGDVFTEFHQDTGSADMPYSPIPGSAQEFGLATAWSLCKYDNSLAGLFKNKMGEVNVSRMAGFNLKQISSFEIDTLLNDPLNVPNPALATAYGYMLGGHPMLQMSFGSATVTYEFDQASNVWSERQSTTGGRHWSQKFVYFVNKQLVSDYANGNIYKIDTTKYDENGSSTPMEVWSKTIWQDDKYLSIPQIQVDIQSGIGLTVGQGSNPQIMLEVSKDGGQTFTSVGWATMGAVGNYATRVIWRRLGRARRWVLKLRITDPVKRVLTGASADIVGGTF